MGFAEHRQASPIHHSTVIKDIAAGGPKRPTAVSLKSSRGRADVARRIYEQGPRSLEEQISEAENTAYLQFPAATAFLEGLFKSFFGIATISLEATRDMVHYYLPGTDAPPEEKRKQKSEK